jgi:TonB family protein
MKRFICFLVLLATLSWCCSPSVHSNKAQEDNFTNNDLVLTKTVASWRNDSIKIKDETPTSAEMKIYYDSAFRPRLVLKIVPHYPSEAVSAGLEGTLYVRVFIDSAGRPRKAVLLKSPTEIFDQPVLHAIMFCTFSPAVVEGKPESIWIAIAVRFDLAGGEPTVEYIEKERYP